MTNKKDELVQCVSPTSMLRMPQKTISVQRSLYLTHEKVKREFVRTSPDTEVSRIQLRFGDLGGANLLDP